VNLIGGLPDLSINSFVFLIWNDKFLPHKSYIREKLTAMLSINIYLRFGLIALFIPLSILLNIYLGFWYAFPFYLALLILILGYIFLGTVQSASNLMQIGDYDGSEKRLRLIFKPDWLYTTNRAYYYLLKGSVLIAKKNIDEGELYLKKAQSINLPSDNEKAMIELQLANISASKGKWKMAEMHLRTIKQLRVTESTLKEQIKQFEKSLSNQGQVKAATRMGVVGQQNMRVAGAGKGKRRRPPMR
jgi:tetratricopeptide (TPR) repeat protein